MKKIGIATDSHCGITQEEASGLGIRVLPMPFSINGECYYEGKSLTMEEFFKLLSEGAEVSTSQPSPYEVTTLWEEALKEYETLLYLPISSGLSGSCQTARMLAQEPEFEGKVFVVDNGRTSTPQHQAILDAMELIEEGYDAETIRKILEDNRDKMAIYVAVDTLEYLKRGGRLSSTAAAVGSLLRIKPILRFDVGTLEVAGKCRGMKKARQEMLELMKAEIDERFPEEYKRGEVHIVAASSAPQDVTNEWVEEIKAYFKGQEVMCDPLSMGLACHIGENGLGIGFSCRPTIKNL